MRHLSAICAGAFAIVLAMTSVTAIAQNTERVTLTDGSIYVGEMVEMVPGDHITIKLASGEIKRFEWAMIIQQPATPPPQQPRSPQQPPNAVHVKMDSSRPGDTELLKVVGTGEMAVSTGRGMAYGVFEQYETVCAAPCETDVDGNGSYKIGGRVTPSSTFNFAGLSRPVNLHVDAGSRGLRVGGLYLAAMGGGLLVGGALLFTFGFLLTTKTVESNGVTTESPNTLFLTLGGIMGGVGIIMLAAGIPMFIAGGTHVTTGDGGSIGWRLSPNVALTPRGLVF